MKLSQIAIAFSAAAGLQLQLHADTTNVNWNPTANPVQPSDGLWTTAANWSQGTVPGPGYKAFISASPDVPAIVNSAAGGCQISIGDGGAGALVVTNGGVLSAGDTSAGNNDLYAWTGLGWDNDGTLTIAPGGAATFNYHLWIGMTPNGHGHLIMNGGTATVMGAFGLGASGGIGVAHIYGGTLNLNQANMIIPNANGSKLDVAGGTVIVNGDYTGAVAALISAGKIVANDGAGTVNVDYNNVNPGKTTLTAAGSNPTRPTITSINVDATHNVTIVYQTTAGSSYHLDKSSTLNPAAWTPITGSDVSSAPGGPVTFNYNESSGSNKMFYRVSSP
jgi:hypothetical protein